MPFLVIVAGGGGGTVNQTDLQREFLALGARIC
jgi:hypothetical protein